MIISSLSATIFKLELTRVSVSVSAAPIESLVPRGFGCCFGSKDVQAQVPRGKKPEDATQGVPIQMSTHATKDPREYQLPGGIADTPLLANPKFVTFSANPSFNYRDKSWKDLLATEQTASTRQSTERAVRVEPMPTLSTGFVGATVVGRPIDQLQNPGRVLPTARPPINGRPIIGHGRLAPKVHRVTNDRERQLLWAQREPERMGEIHAKMDDNRFSRRE